MYGCRTPDFQGKMAFGVLGPVSVSAARRRLEAGAAKAPHGRRGQVSFGKFRVKVLHFMRTSPPGPMACSVFSGTFASLPTPLLHNCTPMVPGWSSWGDISRPGRQKRLNFAPQGRRGQVSRLNRDLGPK